MKMLIGSQIRDIRKKHALTQEELARRSGISVMSLRRYEANERTPGVGVIEKLADALEVSVPFLIGYDIGDTVPSPLWGVYLESKLTQIGYSTGFDEGNATVWLNYPDGTLEVKEDELKELHNSTNEYMRFKLEELRRKRANDFRSR